MAAEDESIGGIRVDIVGDYSKLQGDIDTAASIAAAGGAEIATALNAGAQGADALSGAVTAAATGMGSLEAQIQALVDSGSTLAEALAAVEAGASGTAAGVEEIGAAAGAAAEQMSLFDEAVQIPYADAAGQLNLFADELEPIGAAAETAATGAKTFAESATDAGEAAKTAEGSTHEFLSALLEIGGIALTIEALKSLVEQMVELNAEEERAGEGLAFLAGNMGDAEGQIERLRDLAQTLAVPFDEVAKAAQQMTFRLSEVSSDQIDAALHAVSDAAKVSGESFDGLASSMSRIALTGNLMPRTLASIGSSLDSLADVMGVDVDQVKTKFAELDQSARLDDLIQSIGRVKGATEAMANDTQSQLTRMSNSWSFAIADIGKSVLPLVTEIGPIVITAAKVIGTAFVVVLDSIKVVGAAIGGIVYGIGATIVDLSKIVINALAGDFAGAGSAAQRLVSDWKAVWTGTSNAIVGDVKAMTDSLDSLWNHAGDSAKKTFGGGGGGGGGGGVIPTAIGESIVAFGKFDSASLDMVTAQQAVQDKLKATSDLIAQQGITLAAAQTELHDVLALYDKGLVTWQQVKVALDAVNTAQKAIDQTWDTSPIDKNMKSLADATGDAAGAFSKFIPQVQFLPGPLGEAYTILGQMHVKMGESSRDVDQLARDYVKLGEVPHTLDMMDSAWAKISGSIAKVATHDLPLAIAAEETHLKQMQQEGDAQGAIFAQESKILNMEVTLATQRGVSATAQILNLEKIRLQQQVLTDQTRLLGDMYVGVINDLLKGWESVGKSVADNIIDEKNWADVGLAAIKQIAKSILETLVGTAFKALEDSLLKSTGLMDGLTKAFTKMLGSAGGTAAAGGADAVSGAGSQAAGAASSIGSGVSGALGAIGAVGSVVSAISGIIGNFQNARMETTLNAIEHNTRYLQIEAEKYFQVDEWDRQNNLFAKLDDMWNAIRDVASAVVTGAQGIMDTLIQLASGSSAGRPNLPRVPGASSSVAVPSSATYSMASSSSTSANIGTVNFIVNGAQDPRQVVRQVADGLKVLSPAFAAYGT